MNQVSKSASILGAIGGKAGIGLSKRRSTARAAALSRWASRSMTTRQRLLESISKGGKLECWNWLKSTNHKGYGQISINNKMVPAHRAMWEEFNGPIPEGLCVCHHCDNRKCCNPSHLFIGTNRDNVDDAMKKGRRRGPLPHQTNTCKLTYEKVEQIRAKARNTPYNEIAKEFGITKDHVCTIVNFHSWKS